MPTTVYQLARNRTELLVFIDCLLCSNKPSALNEARRVFQKPSHLLQVSLLLPPALAQLLPSRWTTVQRLAAPAKNLEGLGFNPAGFLFSLIVWSLTAHLLYLCPGAVVTKCPKLGDLKTTGRTPMEVQWSRPRTSNAGSTRLIPSRGPKMQHAA